MRTGGNIMERVKKIAQALYDKKAENIEILDISQITSIGDYFIICTCASSVQVKACADEVEEKLEEMGVFPGHKEGYNGGNWILMDYGDIIVHIMQEETHDFYSLEKLWGDAEKVHVELK